MFSGTASESGFRIVDYTFTTDGSTLHVTPTEPMKLCPEIPNDLNTPFISKDARYIVSYTSSSEQSAYSTGSSLKVFRIAETFPAEGTTRCEAVVDFGFAAGKADFAYDNSQLTFHISKGSYLTPFVNGGLDAPTITDVVVVNLTQDDAGDIVGYSGMARITTSLEQGVGSYFPAFFPDGHLFYVANAVPKKSDANKRFYFKVVDPSAESMMANVFADPEAAELASAIATLWQSACSGPSGLSGKDGEAAKEHEAPWILSSLSPGQCGTLVEEHWSEGLGDKDAMLALCASR